MKILVIGGFGYLGEMVSKFLLDQGHLVRIFDKREPEDFREEQYNAYEIHIGSILEKQDLREVCKGIDCVIHLAALDQSSCMKSPERALEINGLGTKNVLWAAEQENIKLVIYSSTFHIYGVDGKITEQTVPCPKSDYGISKLLGEYYCQQSKVDNVVLRFTNVYGFSTSQLGGDLVVNDLCKQAFENQNIFLKSRGLQKRNFVSINEINQAISLVLNAELEKVSGEIFNVGGQNTISISELAQTISESYRLIFGQEARITISEDAKEELVEEFEYSYDKLMAFGYSPKVGLKEEVTKIFKYLKNDTLK